ncbi:FAD:protein FMN transferase [Shewanella yunxiaonensis]|uniref:FAD:protein FMN transferase n=1 Tax=Shewanella yunxiaonensis TaxID=2829809 RepID=A0ABX7YVM8_9GAMM|nr:FAD:protein FMN transferase [Shewanella yunxiaonensis]QUN06700.1 FAD:protein FMN transferase [Shewanella yunxiaonensis]
MSASSQPKYSPLKVLLYLLVSAAIIYGLRHYTSQPQLQKVEGFAQGTTYHISWWSENPVPTKDIEQQFNATLNQIDAELSTYRDDSYISKLNHSSSTDWQPASTDFIQLIEIAKDIHHKTGGCYDPTIGPLFNLWGFQKDKFNLPTAAEIAAVTAEIGMEKVEVDVTGSRIRKTLPGLQLNFSSMGEGYSISKLAAVLESHDIRNYLVEFGGDMKIRGHKPDGKKWRIAIDRPDKQDDERQPYSIITINDETGVTLDTSGTYRHHFDENGKEYSHILDPRTGAPVNHNLVSASVFGSDPRVSDAWATAMLCLGPQAGQTVAKEQHLEVFFIENDHGHFHNAESEALAASHRVIFDK